ncbi:MULTISPECIES: efflux RND transporter periplasmic adaptor subunit [Paenibacillus]|jgi:membrane fusion protein, macrolide-specific efflux system|uniref:efflux RND transporter periplasmic adaptor subunit n=1 Tax=Paenibacillus TaxID=44249 RepID=UPI00073EFC14|nr:MULTISPECIES: efflux RND transporter periplasmic adaptor subunit [Paenibacillus]MDU4697333.1 efflux RND transporter periplasmic adaptor subunit [Paenibacillus sp.]
MFTKWWMANLSTKRGKVRLIRTLGILSVCLALTVSTGCALLPDEEAEEDLPVITPPTISKKPEYEVRTETIEINVSAVGKIMSQREEPLFFTEDNLHVKEVMVKAGDKVKQGDALIQLDVEDLQKDLRKKKLEFRKQEISMKELLRTKDEKDPIEFEEASIVFEEQRQALEDLEKTIADGTLRAPFSGTVVSVTAQKGAAIKAYDTVAVLSDTSSLVVAAQFAKEDLSKVAVGMKAKVDINAAGVFEGKVKVMPVETSSSDNGNGNGGNAPEKDTIDKYLIVQLDKWPEGVERGRPLSVSIVTQRKENAVLIPISALRTIGSRTYVQVVEEDGSKREADVEVGLQTSTDVEIVKGLTPGQKVVGR